MAVAELAGEVDQGAVLGLPAACRELYLANADVVSRWVRALAGPSADVEDLVHDVFMIAFRRLPEFRSDAKVTTWLYRITLNVVRNHRRRRWFRRWVSLEADLVSAAPSAEETLDQSGRERLLHAVLDRLPERHRSVLLLCELEGRSGEEAAAILGIKVGALWVRRHRARAALVAEIELWMER